MRCEFFFERGRISEVAIWPVLRPLITVLERPLPLSAGPQRRQGAPTVQPPPLALHVSVSIYAPGPALM